MATVHINIGSNLGDRADIIVSAVAAIESALGCIVRRSAPVSSKPWGYESTNEYINVGVNISIDSVEPTKLLESLQQIERSLGSTPHRNPDGSYRDRNLDIDIIAIDELIIDTPRLTIPHPRMHCREFVLRPMIELWPDWRHPISGKTPAEMLTELSPLSKTVGSPINRPE